MPRYLAATTLVLFVGLVLGRAALLRRQGIEAMHFGRMDGSDFVIPPFALVYIYLIFAAAFEWPQPSRQRFFESPVAGWTGVAFCGLGLGLFASSLVSFGRSFRVGIDADNPDRLVTTGVSRGAATRSMSPSRPSWSANFWLSRAGSRCSTSPPASCFSIAKSYARRRTSSCIMAPLSRAIVVACGGIFDDVWRFGGEHDERRMDGGANPLRIAHALVLRPLR